MLAWLVVLSGPARRRLHPVGRAETVGVSRNCSIPITDSFASTEHAQLSSSAGRWLLRDLDSTNGTYVNEQRVVGCELLNGDVLQIGATHLLFCSLGRSRLGVRIDMAALIDEPDAPLGWLVPLVGEHQRNTLLLDDGMVLGSASSASVVFRDDFLSAEHARFEMNKDRWQLVDLGSTNGTRVNGVKIGCADLIDGDRVALGCLELIAKIVPWP